MSSSGSLPPSSSHPSSTSETTRPVSSQSSSPSSSQQPLSSTQVHSSTLVSQVSSHPSTSIDQGVFLSTLPEFSPSSTGASHSGGATSRWVVVITTSVVVGILLFILLMVFMCCWRYRRNLALHARARDRCIVTLHRNASTKERQHNRERKSSPYSTDDHALEYAESEFVIQGLAEQQSDESHDVWYGSKHPYSAEMLSARGINSQGPYLEDPLDRQGNPPKPNSPPLGEDPTTANHSLIITPSRAYLPFPSWRRLSRPPSSPSIYPIILPDEEDGNSVRQLPTPMGILDPETTAVRDRDSGYNNITEKLVLRDCHAVPHILGPGRGYNDISQTGSYCDTPRPSYPPPIPPKSPLRKAMSMRTMLNVQARESEVEL